MDTPENRARLGEIRAEELRLAIDRLGPIGSRRLGYRDSGMMGTPQNDRAGNLWTADLDEAAGRLVRIVRELRPQVIVSYNHFGGYGHPDHIRAARLAVLAFERAGDPAWYPEQLSDGLVPWRPLKRYEIVMDVTRRAEMAELLAERGVKTWLTPDPDETDEQRRGREEHLARMAEATGPRTTSVDIGEQLERKLDALRAHVTQMAPDSCRPTRRPAPAPGRSYQSLTRREALRIAAMSALPSSRFGSSRLGCAWSWVRNGWIRIWTSRSPSNVISARMPSMVGVDQFWSKMKLPIE
jgi:LmbE family N-acetylglucosaminyl deacetylase